MRILKIIVPGDPDLFARAAEKAESVTIENH
jgi:hypothetical protein